MIRRLLSLLLPVGLWVASLTYGQDIADRGTPKSPDFLSEVQPLLAARCLKCHGPESQQGGLRLDIAAAAFRHGDSGEPAIVPGKATESGLFQRVISQDEGERMPSESEPLSAAQIDLLKRWIDAGAVWVDQEAATAEPARAERIVSDAERDHWSFRRLREVSPPDVRDRSWVRSPVDQFIRHAQTQRGVTPSPEAERRTLIRRVYFDVVGLPPEPEDVEAFVHSNHDQTYDKLVDGLLASNHYGERWARHWLDVVRYADSNGQEGDADRPNAYHFRDFVIRSLNDDLPYDTFVRWQLAGDEIAPDNPGAIAATGFIVAGNSTVLDVPMEEEKLRNRANELDDMVSTTGQALLGLTLACARCHDHKYDPLPTRDYYRMMRIFNSGDRTEVPLAAPAQVRAHRVATVAWRSRLDTATNQRDAWLRAARKPYVEQVRAGKIANLPLADAEKTLLRENPEDPTAKKLARQFKKELRIGDADYLAVLPKDQQVWWEELDKTVRDIAACQPTPLPTAFAFADFAPEPRETWFFERGDFMVRNERMDLGFVSVLTKDKTPDDYWTAAREARVRDDSTQQRRAMADWITDLDHGAGALLARVIVNRVWQHHFGEGLVRTVSDFGTRGDLPTHPELLEWLSGELVRSGWSLKHLHRLILTSATYRQGTAANETNAVIDPDNRLLWRRRPRRVESEVLRDSMLAVAGSLNPAMYGPSFKAPIAAEAMQARNVKDPYPGDAKDSPDTRRRSIYMFHKRVVQYPLMQAFDAPDAQQSCGRRVNTTVAPQALALLNDPFVRLRAGELAHRLQTECGNDVDQNVRRAFQLCLARLPSRGELDDARSFVRKQTANRQQRDAALSVEAARQLAVTDLCQMVFALNEFIYVD